MFSMFGRKDPKGYVSMAVNTHIHTHLCTYTHSLKFQVQKFAWRQILAHGFLDGMFSCHIRYFCHCRHFWSFQWMKMLCEITSPGQLNISHDLWPWRVFMKYSDEHQQVASYNYCCINRLLFMLHWCSSSRKNSRCFLLQRPGDPIQSKGHFPSKDVQR